MTSHELAKLLLEQPDYEVCVLHIDKKRHLAAATSLQIFEGGNTKAKCLAILSEGQKVDGNLYWSGDLPFVPEGHHLSKTFSVRGGKKPYDY